MNRHCKCLTKQKIVMAQTSTLQVKLNFITDSSANAISIIESAIELAAQTQRAKSWGVFPNNLWDNVD